MITGASGLVGSALIPYLGKRGHDVCAIVRSVKPLGAATIRWDPEKGFIDYRDVSDVDVIIHLSGENIGEGRWTKEKKEKILVSRVHSTNFLAQILASLERKPRLLLSASAVGFYGSQGNAILTEKSPKGSGFLSDVCEKWEGAADPARRAGIRTCFARFGMILSPKGGALKSLLPPFKYGMGGKIGSGRQWWSWIALEDVCSALAHLIETPELEGAINVVSPFPVTNLEFTKTLGSVLHRPTLMPLPAPLARLAFGEMADELMLASQRAIPDKLIATSFTFRYPRLEDALKVML